MADAITLPHERELLAIVGLAVEAHGHDQDEHWLGLVVCDSYEHVRYVLQKLHDGNRWDTVDGHVKLTRDGIEVGNARIILTTNMLRGIRPDKVLLLGSLGEMWYLLNSMNTTIEAVA